MESDESICCSGHGPQTDDDDEDDDDDVVVVQVMVLRLGAASPQSTADPAYQTLPAQTQTQRRHGPMCARYSPGAPSRMTGEQEYQ